MDLKEIYTQINGNYDEVMGRLMKEERVLKYLRKFVDNTDYESFNTSYGAEDWETAFRAIHSIKGMGLNLSITKMAELGSDVCEEVRNGAPQRDITGMVEDFRREYEAVMEVLKTL